MPDYKGIDDLLAAGGTPRRLAGRQVEEFFDALARTHGVANDVAPDGPQPIISREPLPAFPINVFPESVSRFVTQVADSAGCPVDFPAVAALVVAAAAIGAARGLCVKRGWAERPGMFAAIVAKPGRAKTPALKAIMAPIYEEQERLQQNHRAAKARYREELAEFKRSRRSDREEDDLFEEPDSPPSPPPPMRHLYSTDATTEALASMLESNRKGLLCVHDELASWVNHMNQYRRGADRQFYLSCWSNEPIKVDRKTSEDGPIMVSHPFLCVLGGVQPDLLGLLQSAHGVDDGFLDRLLFAFPDEQPFQGWNDAELDEESVLDWQVTVNRLLALMPCRLEGAADAPQLLQFSDNGRQAFAAFIDALAAEMNAAETSPRDDGFCAKLRGYAARFALVIHLLRWATGECGESRNEGCVDENDVRRATELCNYFRAHASAVHCRLRKSPVDKKIESLFAWMARHNATETTPRQLARDSVAGIKGTKEARCLLETAADRGFGTLEPGSQKGSVRFIVNSAPTRGTDSNVQASTKTEER
jgi:hypothetical protein